MSSNHNTQVDAALTAAADEIWRALESEGYHRLVQGIGQVFASLYFALVAEGVPDNRAAQIVASMATAASSNFTIN